MRVMMIFKPNKTRLEEEGGKSKAASGAPAYNPRMMTALLLYGYAIGVVSSRKIDRICVEDVAEIAY